MTRRFPISYDRWMRVLATAMFIGPDRSDVSVDAATVEIRMGWAFRATLPVEAVTATRREESVISRGVHGWRGRWLVNGSGDGLVRLAIDPRQPGRTAGFPLRLREVTVSVEDPEGLLAAIRTSRR